MKRNIRAVCAAILVAGLASVGEAWGLDVPVAGTSLSIKDHLTDPTRRQASFKAKDSAVPVGDIDPTVDGARIELVNTTPGLEQSDVFDLPAALWRPVSGGYVYRDANLLSGPVKTATIRSGKLVKFKAKGAQMTFSLAGLAQTSVGVAFSSGSDRFCALFGGLVVRDTGLSFRAKLAPAPASCPALATTTTTAAPVTTTTSSSSTTTTVPAGVLARPSDPVVMLGSSVTPMLGTATGDVLAFRYAAAGGTWTQVPVQIDERDGYTVSDCYNGGYNPLGVVEYTDANTWVGADSTPAFDADDELVFMAFDTGDQAPAGARPTGVAASPAAQVTVTDPLTGGTGRLYLFKRTSPALDPSAGKQYVTYQFKFGSSYQYGPADYKAQYDLGGGELEDSAIAGLDAGGDPVYRTHFQKKWIRDTLQIYKGGASGVDILDIDQAEWAGGTCSRNVNTFSNAESCFATNKSGPVRALRQYYGANSGWAMQRTHEFYQSLEIERLNFRLHDGVGNQAYMDHNPNAYGMRYCNDQTLAGVPVDGASDTVGALTQWAMLAATVAGGNQGSYSQHVTVQTNLPDLIVQGVYDDNGSNSTTFSNCYGTSAAISIVGLQAFSSYCTDPYAGQASCSGGWYFVPGLRRYFEATGMTVSQAQQRDGWTRTPLSASAVAF